MPQCAATLVNFKNAHENASQRDAIGLRMVDEGGAASGAELRDGATQVGRAIGRVKWIQGWRLYAVTGLQKCDMNQYQREVIVVSEVARR